MTTFRTILNPPVLKKLNGIGIFINCLRSQSYRKINNNFNYPSVSFAIANVYYGLGDKERTFEWFEKSLQDKEGITMDMNSNPLWDNLRSDPRFIALLKKMGLEK